LPKALELELAAPPAPPVGAGVEVAALPVADAVLIGGKLAVAEPVKF